MLAAAQWEQLVATLHSEEMAALAAAAADAFHPRAIWIRVRVGLALLRAEVIPVLRTHNSLWVLLGMALGRLR